MGVVILGRVRMDGDEQIRVAGLGKALAQGHEYVVPTSQRDVVFVRRQEQALQVERSCEGNRLFEGAGQADRSGIPTAMARVDYDQRSHHSRRTPIIRLDSTLGSCGVRDYAEPVVVGVPRRQLADPASGCVTPRDLGAMHRGDVGSAAVV
jgi:hypothetical protein